MSPVDAIFDATVGADAGKSDGHDVGILVRALICVSVENYEGTVVGAVAGSILEQILAHLLVIMLICLKYMSLIHQ
jgi:hypothetical protein